MADSVEAEAIGVPGKRTFKITATSDQGRAIVWMEKEQLFQVAVAIRRFLAAYPPEGGTDLRVEEPRPLRTLETEFKAGEMSLRHDSAAGVLTLVAEGIEQPEDEPGDLDAPTPAVEFSFSAAAAAALAERALEVCAAGRKPCPFCGEPVDPEGHSCVRSNGHRKVELPPA